MQALQNGRFAVSTWSLHRMLGATYPYSPDPQKSAARQEPYGPGTVNLLDVPKMLAERGLGLVGGGKSARFTCRALTPPISRNSAMRLGPPTFFSRRCSSKTEIPAMPRRVNATVAGLPAGSISQRRWVLSASASSPASKRPTTRALRVLRAILNG